MIAWLNENQGFTNTLLILITLIVSVSAILISTKVQKNIHNRDVKLSLQSKVLEIYNIYLECLNSLLFDDYLLGMKIGHLSMLLNPIDDILDCRGKVSGAYNEAALFFGSDKVLLNTLRDLRNEYLSLSKRWLEILPTIQQTAKKAVSEIESKFPELQPVSLQKILSYDKVAEIFSQANTTPEVEQWEKDIQTFLHKFSDKSFDSLFKKHLLLKQL